MYRNISIPHILVGAESKYFSFYYSLCDGWKVCLRYWVAWYRTECRDLQILKNILDCSSSVTSRIDSKIDGFDSLCERIADPRTSDLIQPILKRNRVLSIPAWVYIRLYSGSLYHCGVTINPPPLICWYMSVVTIVNSRVRTPLSTFHSFVFLWNWNKISGRNDL